MFNSVLSLGRLIKNIKLILKKVFSQENQTICQEQKFFSKQTFKQSNFEKNIFMKND